MLGFNNPTPNQLSYVSAHLVQLVWVYGFQPALLSVEVDILFSPQPIGSEHENRDLQHLSHHKALLNLPRSLAQVSQARTPRQKAQKRSSVKEQRIFRATRVERLRKEFEIMFSVVPTSTPSICVFRMGHNEVSRKRQLDSQRKAREEPN